MSLPVLVYFGYCPAEGAGSAIIVYRHLQRLSKAGWQVRVVADWGHDDALCRLHGWPVLTLSHRKSWWPPFDPDQQLLRAVRIWLWAGEVRNWLGDERPSAVFTYLSAFSDTLSLAAAGFARRYHLPLATVIHDDARCFNGSVEDGKRAHVRRQWILESSRKCWFASPELAKCFQLESEKVGVLPPMPEGSAPYRESPFTAPSEVDPLLIYAGNYWPPQLPTLARLAAVTRAGGGRFLAVLKENPEHVAYLQKHDVAWRAPFVRNVEALAYFRSNAAALVVSYAETTADMPWTRTSFPSKLIEYCHLGVPVVIVAPAETAVVRWAQERKFPDVFAPDDVEGFGAYVTRLRDPRFRQGRAALATSFAQGEFDPSAIHRQLEASLLEPVS